MEYKSLFLVKKKKKKDIHLQRITQFQLKTLIGFTWNPVSVAHSADVSSTKGEQQKGNNEIYNL